MTVCSAVLPAALVALTRSETKPWSAVGLVSLASQRLSLSLVTRTGCQVVPSSAEISSDTWVIFDGVAPTWVVGLSRNVNGAPSLARLEPSKSPVIFTVGTARGSFGTAGGPDVNVHCVLTRVDNTVHGRDLLACNVSV